MNISLPFYVINQCLVTIAIIVYPIIWALIILIEIYMYYSRSVFFIKILLFMDFTLVWLRVKGNLIVFLS